MIWAGIAGASIVFPGGENVTLAVAIAPALLVHQVTNVLDGMNNNFAFAILVGFPVVAVVAWMMDRARISVKTFVISLAIGMLVSNALLLILFLAEVKRSGLQRARSLFDADQPERVIALQILCGAAGLYFSAPVAFLWRAAQAVRNTNAKTSERLP